jgi:hypothetical protein
MNSKTLINIIPFIIIGIILYFTLKKQNREHSKYFGKLVKLTKKEIKILEKFKSEYITIPKDKRLPTLKKDKFILEDVSKTATEIINDFPIPSQIEKGNLKPKDFVKLIFIDKSNIGERMWVEFIQLENGLLKGILKNDSFDNDDNDLNSEKILFFHTNHIFEIEKSE